MGVLGYAEYIILLCSSVAGLIKMIKNCEDYAEEQKILFNGSKSKYLIFGDYIYNLTLKVNNEIVSRSVSAMHLGHMLHTVTHQKNSLNTQLRKLRKVIMDLYLDLIIVT